MMNSVKITLAYLLMLVGFGVVSSFIYAANPGSITTVIPALAGILLASLFVGLFYDHTVENKKIFPIVAQ